MDKTLMEKRGREPKNFSLLLPYSLYESLRILAVERDTNLGTICRELLEEAIRNKTVPVRRR